MDDDNDVLPLGPIVRLLADAGELAVSIEPPLPNGAHHRRMFSALQKEAAWGYARTLWSDHKLGFVDETCGGFGRTGPYTRKL